jgi:hypothetical protein
LQAAQRIVRVDILEDGLALDRPFHHPWMIAEDSAGSRIA